MRRSVSPAGQEAGSESPWRLAGFVLGGFAWAAVLAGCAATPAAVPPEQVLPAFEPVTILEPATADAALAAVEGDRAARTAVWQRREYDCYDRFFTNRCLDAVEGERRGIEARYKLIEVRARQVLRNQRAVDSSQRQAQDLQERQDGAAQDAAERQAAQAKSAARQAEAERRAADKARRGPPNSPEDIARRQREQEAARRERAAQRQQRREEAPANREAFERKQQEQAERQRERDARRAP